MGRTAGTGRKKSTPGESLLDVVNISVEWDKHEKVRERLRNGMTLLDPNSDCDDIPTMIRNKELLIPMLERMALMVDKPHPPIDPLREEVAKMYQMYKRDPMPEWKYLQNEGWRLRHMMCFIKAKVRRKEVSTETLLQWCLSSSLVQSFERFFAVRTADIFPGPQKAKKQRTRTAKNPEFQDLCLLLNPMLQATGAYRTALLLVGMIICSQFFSIVRSITYLEMMQDVDHSLPYHFPVYTVNKITRHYKWTGKSG